MNTKCVVILRHGGLEGDETEKPSEGLVVVLLKLGGRFLSELYVSVLLYV